MAWPMVECSAKHKQKQKHHTWLQDLTVVDCGLPQYFGTAVKNGSLLLPYTYTC